MLIPVGLMDDVLIDTVSVVVGTGMVETPKVPAPGTVISVISSVVTTQQDHISKV